MIRSSYDNFYVLTIFYYVSHLVELYTFPIIRCILFQQGLNKVKSTGDFDFHLTMSTNLKRGINNVLILRG